MSSSKLKILLTGATGFVGTNFVLNLHNKYEIIALVRNTSDTSKIEKFCKIYRYDESIESIANKLNMLEEMRIFALVQRCYANDPTVITPEEAVRCATRAGALSQGREDCGEISEGFRADLVLFDMDTPWCTPQHDPLGNLLWSASGTDVMLTMADGRVVYRQGEWPTLDVARARYEVERIKESILAKL